MRRSPALLLLLLTMCLTASQPALAKGKSKDVLPAYILNAQTAVVLIDPNAGLSPEDPGANQTARHAVESALASWGRIHPVLSNQPADLVIVIRRGTNRVASDTIPDPRQNSRGIGPDENGVGIGMGGAPRPTSGAGAPPPSPVGRSQTEITTPDDTFAVYDGHVDKPLDSPAGWRYTTHDGLRAPGVPAVDQFRKAVAAAEKAAKP
jgi:hypothetical protein